MIINKINNNQTGFNGFYLKGADGWIKISEKSSKILNKNSMKQIYEKAAVKRAVALSSEEIIFPREIPYLGNGYQKSNLSPVPILMTNKTARDFVSLCKDEKTSFFNKIFKNIFTITGDVETTKIQKKELYKLF